MHTMIDVTAAGPIGSMLEVALEGQPVTHWHRQFAPLEPATRRRAPGAPGDRRQFALEVLWIGRTPDGSGGSRKALNPADSHVWWYPFPAKLDAGRLPNIMGAFLDAADYGPEPDIDGTTRREAWRLIATPNRYAYPWDAPQAPDALELVAVVVPMWAEYHK